MPSTYPITRQSFGPAMLAARSPKIPPPILRRFFAFFVASTPVHCKQKAYGGKNKYPLSLFAVFYKKRAQKARLTFVPSSLFQVLTGIARRSLRSSAAPAPAA